jgi:predicted nucleic acid-binding protein
VSRVVIDASVAIKWVVEEEGTTEALAVLEGYPLSAPDLIVAECANILWKKVRRGELTPDEAQLAADLLQGADLEIVPTRARLSAATRLAVELEHPAYDCVYLALARDNGWPFVTADDRLRRGLADDRPSGRPPGFDGTTWSLRDAAPASSPGR